MAQIPIQAHFLSKTTGLISRPWITFFRYIINKYDPTLTIELDDKATANVYNLAATESGSIINNNGCTAIQTINLPLAVVGHEYRITNCESYPIHLVPQPTESITGIAGTYYSLESKGDSAYFICIDAGQWQVLSSHSYNQTDVIYANDPTFGAVGDDSHDDSVPLQAVINTGKPIYLPYGSIFKITYPLTTPDYSVIYGPGTIHMAIEGPGIYPGNYATLKDFTLKGTYGTTAGCWGISTLYQGAGTFPTNRTMNAADWITYQLTCQNVKIQDFWGGILPGPYSMISGCRVSHCHNEGTLILGDGVQLVGNSFENLGSWGIDICASDIVVHANRLKECGVYSILGGTDGGGIVANSASFAAGIKNISLSGNVINGSDFIAILIQAYTYNLSLASIQGNCISDVCRTITGKEGGLSATVVDGGLFDEVIFQGNPINSATVPANNFLTNAISGVTVIT